MDPVPLSKAELFRRRDEVDAFTRFQASRGLDVMTPGLRPSMGTMFEKLTTVPVTQFPSQMNEALRTSCMEVAERRRELLRAFGIGTTAPLGGRWITFSAQWTDYVQLAHAAGFIDESDAPGWDLWVCSIGINSEEPTLLSWVPESLKHQFHEATGLSSAGALHWSTPEELEAAVGGFR
jgi:hypothetical protein